MLPQSLQARDDLCCGVRSACAKLIIQSLRDLGGKQHLGRLAKNAQYALFVSGHRIRRLGSSPHTHGRST